MSGLFNERMTYSEAQYVFFSAVEGKTEHEIAQIKEEFLSILPVITKRELDTHPTRLTSHPGE